jgi:hypothetical protein
MSTPTYCGEYRTGKTNDCSVRALSNASLTEYEDCEQLLADYGRKLNRGVSLNQLVKACSNLGLKKVQTFGKKNQNKLMFAGVATGQKKGVTLRNFINQHQKGRFVVLYSRHVVAVVDGQVVDTINNNQNVRVIASFSQF